MCRRTLSWLIKAERNVNKWSANRPIERNLANFQLLESIKRQRNIIILTLVIGKSFYQKKRKKNLVWIYFLKHFCCSNQN